MPSVFDVVADDRVIERDEGTDQGYYHQMWLTAQEPPFDVFRIPVPPEVIAGGTEAKMKTYDIIGFGEVARQGGVTLERIRWESHFPKDYDPSIETVPAHQHIDPEQWCEWLYHIQRTQKTVRLTILNTRIDFVAMVPTFRWGYEPGPAGDIWYQIECLEKRVPMIRQFNGVNFPAVDLRTRPFGDYKDKYVVKPGQSLMDVTRAVYGSDTRWRDIYYANFDALYKGKELWPGPPEEAPAGLLAVGPQILGDPAFFDLWRVNDPLPGGTVLRIPDIR